VELVELRGGGPDLAGLVISEPEVQARTGVVRLQLERATVLNDGVRIAPRVSIGRAEIRERQDGIRTPGQVRAITFDGLCGLPLLVERDGALQDLLGIGLCGSEGRAHQERGQPAKH
jgi:hypothetical protein